MKKKTPDLMGDISKQVSKSSPKKPPTADQIAADIEAQARHMLCIAAVLRGEKTPR